MSAPTAQAQRPHRCVRGRQRLVRWASHLERPSGVGDSRGAPLSPAPAHAAQATRLRVYWNGCVTRRLLGGSCAVREPLVQAPQRPRLCSTPACGLAACLRVVPPSVRAPWVVHLAKLESLKHAALSVTRAGPHRQAWANERALAHASSAVQHHVQGPQPASALGALSI